MWCRSAVTFPSFSVLLLVVCDPAPGTRFPGSEPGACFAVPHSPRSPPFAPPAPLLVAQLCSSVSQLLWQSLTSHVRSSSAMAPRLPDADQIASWRLAGRGISRFPCNELPHMPGSSTTPGPPGGRACAPVCIAFRLRNGVSTRDMNLCGAQWLAYVLLCRRFAAALAGDSARLEVDVDRSGRTEARTGLRMMPTSPRSPYHSVRRVFPSTAGRLALQAGPSPIISGLSPLPAYAVRCSGCIPPSCTPWAEPLSRTVSGPTLSFAPP